MILPSDWDKPSKENKELCDRFSYNSFDYSGVLLYRLFVPDSMEKVPLVVFLHGADAFGSDNELQLSMHDIGTVFARDEWQSSHPCFVLAPQCSKGRQWSNLLDASRVCALIKALSEKYTNIDLSRIYIYGYSAGAVGCFGILKYHADIFAGAVAICGATGKEDLKVLTRTPIWMVHAADDAIVRASYRSGGIDLGHLGSRDIYEDLKDTHPDLHYTEYEAGLLKERYGLNPHCSWVLAGMEENIKEWLFGKRIK